MGLAIIGAKKRSVEALFLLNVLVMIFFSVVCLVNPAVIHHACSCRPIGVLQGGTTKLQHVGVYSSGGD